ncbi:hypothetical protein AMECASPLE_032065 [Ameca splendens]|uniref:Uncharacterized protein n=1 Tax=Ameca splendens TaxID=208324 RepID=A0ABV1ADR1_9TELE
MIFGKRTLNAQLLRRQPADRGRMHKGQWRLGSTDMSWALLRADLQETAWIFTANLYCLKTKIRDCCGFVFDWFLSNVSKSDWTPNIPLVRRQSGGSAVKPLS